MILTTDGVMHDKEHLEEESEIPDRLPHTTCSCTVYPLTKTLIVIPLKKGIYNHLHLVFISNLLIRLKTCIFYLSFTPQFQPRLSESYSGKLLLSHLMRYKTGMTQSKYLQPVWKEFCCFVLTSKGTCTSPSLPITSIITYQQNESSTKGTIYLVINNFSIYQTDNLAMTSSGTLNYLTNLKKVLWQKITLIQEAVKVIKHNFCMCESKKSTLVQLYFSQI